MKSIIAATETPGIPNPNPNDDDAAARIDAEDEEEQESMALINALLIFSAAHSLCFLRWMSKRDISCCVWISLSD